MKSNKTMSQSNFAAKAPEAISLIILQKAISGQPAEVKTSKELNRCNSIIGIKSFKRIRANNRPKTCQSQFLIKKLHLISN